MLGLLEDPSDARSTTLSAGLIYFYFFSKQDIFNLRSSINSQRYWHRIDWLLVTYSERIVSYRRPLAIAFPRHSRIMECGDVDDYSQQAERIEGDIIKGVNEGSAVRAVHLISASSSRKINKALLLSSGR